MVQIDIPVAFGTGSLFAAAVGQGLRADASLGGVDRKCTRYCATAMYKSNGPPQS